MPPRRRNPPSPADPPVCKQALHARGRSPFDITDERCDLRGWQAWWEARFDAIANKPAYKFSLDDLGLDAQASHLGEGWAGHRQKPLQDIRVSKELMSGMVCSGYAPEKEEERKEVRAAREDRVERRWANWLTDTQREDIILHTIWLTTLNHFEIERAYVPELVPSVLARDDGPPLWSIINHFLLLGEEPEDGPNPILSGELFDRWTAGLQSDSPFPAKRGTRVILVSTLLMGNAYLAEFAGHAVA